jgi:predicted ester cyclase
MVDSPTREAENKRVVRRIREEVEEQGNLDAVDELVAADAVLHTPMGDVRGREAIRAMYEADRVGFPDYTETVHEVVAEGDTVAVRLTERGTHEGEFMGLAPTGREYEVQTMAFLHVEDGTVTEWWTQPDTLGLVEQLGFDPDDLRAAMPAGDD